MPATHACPLCRQQLEVPQEFLGRLIRCPGCGETIRLPPLTAAPGGPAASPSDAPPPDHAASTAIQEQPQIASTPAAPERDTSGITERPGEFSEPSRPVSPSPPPRRRQSKAPGKPRASLGKRLSRMRRVFKTLRLGTTFVLAGELLFLILGIGGRVFPLIFPVPELALGMALVQVIGSVVATVFLLIGTILGIAAPPVAGARAMAIVATFLLLLQMTASGFLVVSVVLLLTSASGAKEAAPLLVLMLLVVTALYFGRNFFYKFHLRQLAVAIGRDDVRSQATGVLIFDCIVYGLIILLVGAAFAMGGAAAPGKRVPVRAVRPAPAPVPIRQGSEITAGTVIGYGVAAGVVLLAILWLVLYLRLVYSMRNALEEEIKKLPR